MDKLEMRSKKLETNQKLEIRNSSSAAFSDFSILISGFKHLEGAL